MTHTHARADRAQSSRHMLRTISLALDGKFETETLLRRRGRRLSRGLTRFKTSPRLSLFLSSPYLRLILLLGRAAFNRAPGDYLNVESTVSLQTASKLRTFVSVVFRRATQVRPSFHELTREQVFFL